MRNYILFVAIAAAFTTGCKNKSGQNHGPIVMGDSSTIVTEQDSQYLHDFVADLHPTVPSASEDDNANSDTAKQAEQPTDSTKQVAQQEQRQQQAPPAGNGLNVAFKDVTVFIPNVTTKAGRNQDLSKANGATYQLASGNLAGNTLKITQGTVTKVSQRYETIVLVKNNLGTLQLDDLSSTTDWQPLKGVKNQYSLSGLDAAHLQYDKATPAEIRNAVAKEARKKRMSRQKQQEWANSVHNVHNLNQRPMAVVLRSVMWKIEGKDAKGKAYQKQVRIDLPY